MSGAGFQYSRNARAGELAELAREISPMEAAQLPPGLSGGALAAAFAALAAGTRTYTVRLGGRLCGVCFVEDLPDRRLMSFTKTRFLASERRVTFARGIGRLLRDLAAAEREAGRDARPMYMHVPEGDFRSMAWFARAGCVPEGGWLRCPGADRGI